MEGVEVLFETASGRVARFRDVFVQVRWGVLTVATIDITPPKEGPVEDNARHYAAEIDKSVTEYQHHRAMLDRYRQSLGGQ